MASSLRTTTNVVLPLAGEVPVQTNTFASNGNFTNTLPFRSIEPKRFYLLNLQ